MFPSGIKIQLKIIYGYVENDKLFVFQLPVNAHIICKELIDAIKFVELSIFYSSSTRKLSFWFKSLLYNSSSICNYKFMVRGPS